MIRGASARGWLPPGNEIFRVTFRTQKLSAHLFMPHGMSFIVPCYHIVGCCFVFCQLVVLCFFQIQVSTLSRSSVLWMKIPVKVSNSKHYFRAHSNLRCFMAVNCFVTKIESAKPGSNGRSDCFVSSSVVGRAAPDNERSESWRF